MDVMTKTNGLVSVEEKQLLKFPEGIMGFEEFHNYALIESEYEPFIWLQSVDNKNLAFLLVDPFLICNDYEAEIDDSVLKTIGVESPEDIVVMTIVTIPQDNSPITANFLGPIVINRRNNTCVQVVLNDNRWTTKFNIIDSLKKKGE